MLKSIFNDALYRGSLILLGNTVALAAFGFAFWALAARAYPPAAVGTFAGITSGTTLLGEVASLGLPNTITRHVASAPNARQLMRASIAATSVLGGVLCLATVVVIGPHLPAELHLRERGGTALLVTGLAIFTATSGVLQAGLVATRASHTVAITNLIASIAKVTALLLLARLGSAGLLTAYGIGVAVASVLGGLALWRRLDCGSGHVSSLRLLRSHLSMTTGNYAAMIMGILPSSVVPIEVLIVLGPAATARFSIAFLIAGFLNFIPATVAQVLFAEASRPGVSLNAQLRKALRVTYGLLLPPLVVLVAGAPLVLRLFGPAYASDATGCLRVLALSALLTGGTYLVDSILIARDRVAAYTFVNGANAALVLGGVGILLPHGLTAAAWGWAGAQGISLLIGSAVMAAGGAGRHRLTVPVSPARPSQRGTPRQVIFAFEPQIRDLLDSWPLMPTTLIAERIGWSGPIPLLLNQVTKLRLDYLSAEHARTEVRHPPGELAQCGLWFPPVEVPVGCGQTRSATQLPVLTMITGYSRWMSALLIPSTQAQDLFEGWWQLLVELGSAPTSMTWDSETTVGHRTSGGVAELTVECQDFARATGTEIVIGDTADPRTRSLIERAHACLEHSFLPGKTFSSPANLNTQLAAWLAAANTRTRPASGRSPTDLIATDKRAMLQLPSVRPATGWHISARIEAEPFISFDFNSYSVHPRAARSRVELTADLSHVSVVCNGVPAASHRRSWTRYQTISEPDHLAAAGLLHPGQPRAPEGPLISDQRT